MGKIADAIRGAPLPEQNRKKLLALDQEFVNMEAEIQALNSKNLHLQAQVNPLEREVQRLKNEIEKNATHDQDRLDELSEKILIVVANSNMPIREKIIQHLQLSQAKGELHFDILEEKN